MDISEELIRRGKMMEQREIGWWIPEPKSINGKDEASLQKLRRMRFAAVWFLRIAVLSGVCFTGLLYFEADVSVMGAFFGGALWACGAVMLIGLFIIIAWTM